MKKQGNRISAFLLAFVLTVASVFGQVPVRTYAADTSAATSEWTAIEGDHYGNGDSNAANAKPSVKDENGTVKIGLDYSANSGENSTANIRKDEKQDISGKKYIGYSLNYPKELDGKLKSNITGITKEVKEVPSVEPSLPPEPVVEKGMHVVGNKLYDSDDNEFIFRGVNLPHAWYTQFTEKSINDVAALGANSVRVVLGSGEFTDATDGKKHGYNKTPKSEVEDIIKWCKAKNLVCVLELHDFTGTNTASNITTRACDYWLELKDLLNENKDYVIVNIANEWQGAWNQGDLWKNTYKDAVKKLRDAGLENALMIDASGWGQETGPITEGCKEVLAADKDGNTIFSVHVYSVLGENQDTIDAGLNPLRATGVCMCVGEFAYWQNKKDVDERYLVDYCQQYGIGWLAWSWAGNGGDDAPLDMTSRITFSKDDLTEWGKWVFGTKNGIQATSKMPYTNAGFSGTKITGTPNVVENPKHVEPPEPPVIDSTDDIPVAPDKLMDYEWKLCKNGDDTKSCEKETLVQLSNGGWRIDNIDMDSADGDNQPMPTLYTMSNTGWNLSGHNTIDLVVRNTNAEPIQVNLVLKTGDNWTWVEPNKPTTYLDVAGRTTQLISFDISSAENLNKVRMIAFRVWSGTGKATHPIDFCSMGFDLDKNAHKTELVEMNRPKYIEYFTWQYPEISFKQDITTKLGADGGAGEGKLTIEYTNITDQENYTGGVQTETKPGLGEGMDCSPYAGINATLTNNSNKDIHCTLVVKTSAGWDWSENSGMGNDECIIPAGESKRVGYSFKDSFWKSKETNWQFNGSLANLDDVRAIAFKIYPGNGETASGSFTISDFSFQTNARDLVKAYSTGIQAELAEVEENTKAVEADPIAAVEYIEKEAFNKEAVFYNKKYDPATKTYTALVYAPLSDVTATSIDAVKVGFTGVKTNFKGTVTMTDFKVFDQLPEKVDQILPTDLKFAKETYTLTEGDQENANLVITPEKAEVEGLSYKSGDPTVATIDSKGLITAVKPGETTITATWDDITTTSKVVVEKKIIAVTGVKLSLNELELKVGGSGKLTATVNPTDADNQNITWSVDDESIATVEDGIVKAVKAGTAKVTVTTEDGNFTDTCVVTVKENIIPVESVTLDQTNLSFTEGDAAVTIHATVLPDNATNKEIVWDVQQEPENVVKTTVNADGSLTITPKNAGAARIKVLSKSGGVSAECLVYVKPPVIIQTPDQPSVEPEPPTPEIGLLPSWTMEVGQVLEIPFTIANAGDNEIKCASSSLDVAEVQLKESEGKNFLVVTAKKQGYTEIKLTVGDKTATCNITVNAKPEQPIQVTGITLNPTSLELPIGSWTTLTPKIEPSDATVSITSLEWTSNNESVVTVENGNIKAIAPGKATITVMLPTANGFYSASCVVTVPQPDPTITHVRDIKFTKDQITLKPNDTDALEVQFAPVNPTNNKVFWSVTDEKVISVDGNGKVTAKAPGYAWVTAISEDGGYMAICRVEVTKTGESVFDDTVYVSKVDLTSTEGEMHIGDTAELASYVVITPSNATNPVVSWTSDHPEIAEVDSKTGKVTAIAEGTATITVSVTTGDVVKTTTYKVTVLPKDEEKTPEGVEIPVKKLVVNGVTKSALTLDYSKTVKTLNVAITPTTSTNKKLTVKSGNKKILKASVSGTKLKLTTVKPGATTVTVSSQSLPKVSVKFTVTVRPAKVSSLKAAAVSKTSIKLSWKKAANVSGYKVYTYNTKTKKWKLVKTIKSAKTTTYTATKLKKKTTYQYKVTAIVKSGSKYIEGDTSKAATLKKATKSK